MAARVRAAIERVKAEVRRLPPNEAEAVLSAALGDDRRAFKDRDISRLVRHLQDPWWSVKHPVHAMRELRRR
jgi:hypothetical protein